MIFQLDHIAISPTNFDSSIGKLEKIGYLSKFIERDIKNLKIKEGLMRNFTENQSLALFLRKKSFGIELVNQADLKQEDYFAMPIFENPPNSFIKETRERVIGKELFAEALTDFDDYPVLIKKGSDEEDFSFNKIFLRSNDINESEDFWTSFGFRVIVRNSKFMILEFKSLFNEERYRFYIKEDVLSPAKFYLDNKGCNCVAFISNSLEKDKKMLSDKGFESTDIEPIRVNNRNLKVFFVTGPQGELVEIISIEK